MKTESRGKLLRIFVDEADWHGKQPLFMALIEALKNAGFVGATVLKGIEGHGVHKSVHSTRTFDLSTNLPVLIEVIESEEKFSPSYRRCVR